MKSRASIVKSVCCLVLPCPILSCLVLSCLVLSCLVVDFHYVPHVFVLPPSPRSIRQPSERPFPSLVKSVVLCCVVLCCVVLCCLVLSCLVLSCLVVDFHYVPHVFVLPPSPPSIRQPSELPFPSLVKSVVLCCVVLSCLVLSCVVLSCPILSCGRLPLRPSRVRLASPPPRSIRQPSELLISSDVFYHSTFTTSPVCVYHKIITFLVISFFYRYCLLFLLD